MNKILYFLFATFLFSCGSKNGKETFKASSVKYARNFKLIQKKEYMELVIISPKDRKVESKYALVKDKKKLNLPQGLIRIDVPVKNIGAYSTTFIGMISTLNEISSVKATTSSKYIYNRKLKKYIREGKVLTSDFDGSDSPSALLGKNITLLIYSGFGTPFPNQNKLKQLGINCMANYDWEERHPLGKAEWIKLYGALYDKSEEADAYFDEVSSNYFRLKKKISLNKTHEKVMIGGMVGDVWIASAGKSHIAGIMKDAGLDYVYKNSDGTASNMYTLSQIIRDETKCSRWINAEADNMKTLLRLNPKFATFNTVKNQQVYSYFNNSNYFWEYASLHPEWLLEDFAIIGGSLPQKKMHFYQRLK